MPRRRSRYEVETERLDSWAASARPFLAAVFERFAATGEWPEAEALQRSLARAGADVAVAETAWAMPPELGFVDGQRVVLTPRGLSYLPAAQPLLASLVRLLRLAGERYRGAAEPTVSRDDLTSELGLDKQEALLVSRVFLRDGWPTAGGTGDAADAWVRTLRGEARHLEGLRSIGEYLELRGRQLWPGTIAIPRRLDRALAWVRRPQSGLSLGDLLVIGIVSAVIGGVGVWLITDVLSSDPAPDPVAVVVEDNPNVFDHGPFDWTSYAFVIPRAPEDIPPPPGRPCRRWRAWAYRLGGFDASHTTVRVTVQAQASAAVLIDGMTITTDRRAPLAGTTVQCDAAGGASASPRIVGINLDRDPPTAGFFERDAMRASEPPMFKLLPGDTEVLDLTAASTRCQCRWSAELQLLVNGERRSYTVPDDGSMLTTAATRRTRYVKWSGKAWVRARADPRATFPVIATRRTG